MKVIMSILLIILMSMSQQKENIMVTDTNKNSTPWSSMNYGKSSNYTTRSKTSQPPAWMGRTRKKTGSTEKEKTSSSPRMGNAFVSNQFDDRLNQAAGGQATGTYIPKTNVLMGTNRPSMQSVRTPAWMTRQAYPGYGAQPAPNINPNMPSTPTGSFLAADGDKAQGTNGQAVPTSIPTGSVLAANGQAVLGPNGSQAYWPWMPQGVNTFIGGGGQAVRGPEGTIYDQEGYGGGFGTRYRGWGGGGGGGSWSPPAWNSNDPAYMNLYSWNYKG